MKYFIVRTENKKMEMKAIKEMKHEVAEYGFHFSEEDFAYLKMEQQVACKQNKMIDLEYDIILKIASKVKYSPYIRDITYIPLVKEFIYIFYILRSRSKMVLYDDEIIDIMFEIYVEHYGILEIEILQDCQKRIKEQS